jgi:hypothetical protein
MDLPQYDSWKLEEPDRFDTQKEDNMTTEKRIDTMFKNLSKAKQEAFRILLTGLGAGMNQSDFYTENGGPKAGLISEPCSVACMTSTEESDLLSDEEHDDLTNSMFDVNGVLDQTLLFILEKIFQL